MTPERESPATPEPSSTRKRSGLARLLDRACFFRNGGQAVGEYDPAVHAPLVEAAVSLPYEELDRYWIVEGLSLAVIARNTQTNQAEYLLFEPVLSEFEYELLERLHPAVQAIVALALVAVVLSRKAQVLLVEYGLPLDDTTTFKLRYYLERNFLGWSRIDALMKDPRIEDISCDGTRIPLFLYHRQHQNIKTNILFDELTLNSLAITLAQRSGKHVSIGSPLVDAALPDGSRLQLTFGNEITTHGTSFTIRKFREAPFTPVELIEANTFDVNQLVYFWMAIENNKSLLFVGGTASGKTTSLNAVALSIEDTREITLYHENWVANVTRDTVSEGLGATIGMFDLLKAAMRQRPEYILVGEVRGSEAQTLFQAMNTGHTTFSTMHAGGVDAAIHRLENEPLNVPRNMLQALDVISVQALTHREIVELAGIDPVTGSLQVNTVYEYNAVPDTFSYSGRSRILGEIMEYRGWSRTRLDEELRIRRSVLLAMHEQGIRDYRAVARIVQAFTIDRDRVLASLDDLGRLIR